jgi:hypothetical protein
MKTLYTPSRLTLLGICVSFVLSSCFINIGSLDSVVGNGNIQTRTRDVAAFTKIENRTFADIDITTKAAQKVELTTDENIQPVFITEVTNGKLIITTSSASISTRTARFTISMQTLDELNNTGSGDISATGMDGTTQAFVGNTGSGDISVMAVQTPTLSVSGIGSGNIALRSVATQTLTANVSGSGSLSMRGTGNTGTFTVSGSGSTDARDFTLQRATARTTGSGSIRLSVVQSLDATVTGSGSITYFGSPTVNVNITGSGSVTRGN